MSDPFQSTLALFDPQGTDGVSASPEAVHDEDDDGGVGGEHDTRHGRSDAEPGGARASPERGGSDAGAGFRLRGDRPLARGWWARARDNLDTIRLARELEASGRAATSDEQARLLRFTGFGATDLAQGVFALPSAAGGFRAGWEAVGAELAVLVPPEEYAALRRATQYAHYTPEPVVRAVWAAALHLGFRGGRVLEPGMGTGLFLALAPDAVAERCRFTGVEVCPTTARIARLLHPGARVRCEDYTRSRLDGGFDLVVGNPPFSRRVVRPAPGSPHPPLALHDHFVAASVARLRPGGVALFVTSTGTMDKPDHAARAHVASMADMLGAVRLPEGSFRATAGTEVVVDVIALQRRAEGTPAAGEAWTLVTPVPLSADDSEEGAPDAWDVNEYFAAHPEMVLGRHALRRGVYGPGLSYTCAGDAGPGLEERLTEALARLPAGVINESGAVPDNRPEDDTSPVPVGTTAEGATVKEGSYLVGADGALRQVVGGAPVAVPIRKGRGGGGVARRDAEVVRALLPVRDAVREVLRAQAADRPWGAAQARLRTAYGSFARRFGPINRTEVVHTADPATGGEREVHRRPNLAPFADDPDCWLVASVEEYDPDTGLARMGAVFRERVVAPPPEPVVAGPADALAVALAEAGRVDLPRVCELLDCEEERALEGLGALVFRDPRTGGWETADAYLSGPVRAKLAAARQAAADDPAYARNVEALLAAQPEDLRPSDISARLGAPWIPADAVEAFARERMGGTEVRVLHSEAFAAWTVEGAARFAGTAAGTSEWGTPRRHAGALLHDALNGATPQVFDTVLEDGRERRVLNPEATEAAKEKLQRIKCKGMD